MIDEILTECIFYFSLILLTGYVLGLLKLYSGLNKINYNLTQHTPLISIIVSMHNEEKNASQCIESLLNQDYPKNKLEIIFIDDRSIDRTSQIIAKYSSKFDQIKTIAINELNPDFAPKKRAIDAALQQASGEIILLTDADGRPGSLWAKKIVSYFADNVGMVIGYAPYFTKPTHKSTIYKLLSIDYLSHAAVAASTCGLGFPATCVGTNIAYRKEVYLKLGGFGKYKNYHSGDDDLFLQRVRDETDYEIRYAASGECHVYNAPPNNWKKFYNQRLRYASKGFFYPLKMTLALSALFIFNLQLILFPFLFYNYNNIFFVSIVSIAVKTVFDYFFMKKAAKILNDKRHILLIPIASILHILYVIYFGLMGQIQIFEWADHKQQNMNK